MSAMIPLVLRVIGGAMAGTVFRVTGESVTVGRSPDCDIAIADPSLSRRHFELAWTGDGWRISDLGSRNGISVNGALVQQAVVRPGDEIRAGEMTCRLKVASARLSELKVSEAAASDAEQESTVSIQLFRSLTPTLRADAPVPAEGTLSAALAANLRPEASCRLYALIDGAQAFDLAFAGRAMGHELYTLFSGSLAQTAAHVGPCLVVIGERSAFLRRWVEQSNVNAGVLFESSADLKTLCAHLRRVFVATDDEGQEYFFRFYDPRVLRTFLPTCREDELREFFGPIERWIAETQDRGAFTVFSLDRSRLVMTPVAAAGAEH